MPGTLDFTSFRRCAFQRFQSHTRPRRSTSHPPPPHHQPGPSPAAAAAAADQQRGPCSIPAIVVTPAAPELPPVAAPYQQLQSLFFLLPGELRNAIYATYLSVSLRTAHHMRADAFALRTTALTKRRRPLPALMLTCRRLYNELTFPAASYAAVRVSWGYAQPPAVVGVHPLSGAVAATTTTAAAAAAVVTEVAFYGAVAWERLRTLHFVVDMRRARFTCWFFFAAQVLRGCAGLRELVVDWRPVEDISDVAANDAVVENHNRRLQALVARRFLFAIAQVETLRLVVFRGADVPDSWLAYVREEGAGRGLMVVKEAAQEELAVLADKYERP